MFGHKKVRNAQHPGLYRPDPHSKVRPKNRSTSMTLFSWYPDRHSTWKRCENTTVMMLWVHCWFWCFWWPWRQWAYTILDTLTANREPTHTQSSCGLRPVYFANHPTRPKWLLTLPRSLDIPIQWVIPHLKCMNQLWLRTSNLLIPPNYGYIIHHKHFSFCGNQLHQ